jgi:2-succinyl-5-enolpyruvyl-6-hydroxy-3-cyclohexene-1-carboxylate synthase
MGGMVVSKKIKAFLRQYQPDNHWHIGRENGHDTYYCLSHHFKISPKDFFEAFLPLTRKVNSSYYNTWAVVRGQYRERRDAFLGKVPFSDFKVFSKVLQSIPDRYQLQLANSSTVRYTQLFDLHRSLRVFCNRGTSGIDGSTSTAIGAALADKNPTLLITGDLSLFYDSNAFWNNYIRPDFRIIVVNNHGGGIFRILPGQEDTEVFDTFFETVHDLDIRHLCSLYRLDYTVADNGLEMEEALESFFDPSERPRLLEIRTPRLENNKILLAYFEYLS